MHSTTVVSLEMSDDPNFVSADIELIVNDASRIALKNKSKITMSILEKIISETKPSLSPMELSKYHTIKAKIEGNIDPRSKRPRIGF